MNELKIVATVIVNKEFENELLTVFRNLVDETRKEEGNISYDLHKDLKNPLKYIILERWKSQEAIDLHNDTKHYKSFAGSLKGKIESLNVDIIQKVY